MILLIINYKLLLLSPFINWYLSDRIYLTTRKSKSKLLTFGLQASYENSISCMSRCFAISIMLLHLIILCLTCVTPSAMHKKLDISKTAEYFYIFCFLLVFMSCFYPGNKKIGFSGHASSPLNLCLCELEI